jgi:GAF domain-containing protein
MPELLMQRLQRCCDLQSVLDCVLSWSLELTGTALGNIQLMDWQTGYLTIAAQRGFDNEFLSFFRLVNAEGGSACGRAKRKRSSIVIEDVLLDREFAPCRMVALAAGFRAVQSTPLISSGGAFLGVLSTHFSTSHRPLDSEMEAIKTAARLAADAIIDRRARARSADSLGTKGAEERIASSLKAVERSYELLRRIDRRLKH